MPIYKSVKKALKKLTSIAATFKIVVDLDEGHLPVKNVF